MTRTTRNRAVPGAHYDDPTLLSFPMHHGHRTGEYLLPGHLLEDTLNGAT